jgi:hypothetical protein
MAVTPYSYYEPYYRYYYAEADKSGNGSSSTSEGRKRSLFSRR